MAKRHNLTKNGYTQIPNEILVSAAYKDMSGNVAKVLIYFLQRTYRSKKRAIINPEIDATNRQIMKGVGTKSMDLIAKAVIALIEKYGFIERIKVGHGPAKTPSIYRLCENYRKWGTRDFKPGKVGKVVNLPGEKWDD